LHGLPYLLLGFTGRAICRQRGRVRRRPSVLPVPAPGCEQVQPGRGSGKEPGLCRAPWTFQGPGCLHDRSKLFTDIRHHSLRLDKVHLIMQLTLLCQSKSVYLLIRL